MRDDFATEVARAGDDDDLRAIVREVCELTGMGFAAVACVTQDRWITCQVADRVAFGLDPGDELEVQTTICDELRQCGNAIVIDEVRADPAWRTHHTPALYGFESYASFPVTLADGTFFGTLCAIDSAPRTLTAPATMDHLRRLATRAGEILSARMQSSLKGRLTGTAPGEACARRPAGR